MVKNSQKIAVVGAGIVGLCSAYALSLAGHCVHLFDPQGFDADNASVVAGGMLAPYSEIEHMDMRWVRAGVSGIAFWRDFEGKAGFVQKGSLLVAHNEDRHIWERFREHLERGAGACFEVVPVAECEPDLSENFRDGVFLGQEAHLYPVDAMAALIDVLRARGVACSAEAVKPDALAEGYDLVLDCRGMAAAVDEEDLRGVKGEIVVVRNPDFSLSRPVRLMHPRYPLYIVPRADHHFMIGATMVESEGGHVSLRSAMELMSALYSLHPSFSEAEIVQLISGVRPAYADNLPRITVVGNVVRCNGLFRHGFLLAPVMADIVADYAAGNVNEFYELFTGGDRDECDDQWRGNMLRSTA